MAILTGERWRALSPYLDQALDLAPEERASWLANLRREDAALAADLEANATLKDVPGRQGRDAASTRRALVALYEALRQPDKAEPYRR